MPIVNVKGLDHYYEERGSGQPLVFVHGAFVDSGMWESQVDYFWPQYRVVRYDLRGHGRTGPSTLPKYTIATFADDLAHLLDALSVERPIICGISLGGMIAQSFAVRNPKRLKELILSDTAVSVSLTLSDKLQRYVLFPKWAMFLTIRLLGAREFTRLPANW